ncbi:MAG: N-acetylmuramoyl-L-alanine amidase [Candidatus Eremiobacteraeota bacterium]|nr:N-acetylmuramoyl-L-alanine amidase [Candidatus Eremiobacteraeota bacterium]
MFASRLLIYILFAAALSSAQAATLPRRLFVIDPGHGVRTPSGAPLNVGAVSRWGLSEARINVLVSERVAARLRAKGARVILTRSFSHVYRTNTDPRSDNRARAALANRLAATAFIAIHCDSSLDPLRHGYSVFWLHQNSVRMAANMRRALSSLGLGESQFRPRELAVTKQATVPAVLVELGFISNRKQAARLADPRFQDREASAIVSALQETFGY